ncbi:MAG: T9SS type A sorting domain-containing protein, partial [Bacteroidaceae bacterium]|nr:T9SS type A sorting domain-containing protein [Bacteroidaceae bacterium]
TQILHFGAENLSELQFTARVHALNGLLLVSFPASEECSLSHLPPGTYIVSWTEGGRTRSIKFLKGGK